MEENGKQFTHRQLLDLDLLLQRFPNTLCEGSGNVLQQRHFFRMEMLNGCDDRLRLKMYRRFDSIARPPIRKQIPR